MNGLFAATALLLVPAAGDGGTPDDFFTAAERIPALRTGGSFFLRDATLLTVTHGTIEQGDLLVQDGKLAAIGRDLSPPAGWPAEKVLDGRGWFVSPGIIDCHSHAAIEGGVNEGTLTLVPEVRIDDEIDPKDPTLWLALAGGTTAMNLLHGSANVVGGQNAVIKLRWGKGAAELLFEGAPRGVKFALGENPKRSNDRGGSDRERRYPATRMGVEAVLRRAFAQADDYRRARREWTEATARGAAKPEPRRDLRLEALVDIMEGRILVHSHCYRADEILMLMRVAEDFGFRIKTLQHVLEGYKVAPEIAKHGAGPSSFADWWAYKLEAYDAIPFNAALLELAGARCSLNSDSAELTRRLHHEAAKSLRDGNLDEARTLAQVTINPAWQLGIDGRVGSLEVGKDADLAVWNGHPLSVYTRCELTFIDGECYFQRAPLDAPRTLNATGPVFGPIDCPDPSQLPLPGDGGIYALVGGTVHPVSGPAIEKGVVLIEGGRITAVGADVRAPDHAEVVRCDGLHVYPGLIDGATTLGLGEIASVPAGQDMSELGGIEPDLRVTAAVHPGSALIPVTRRAGITSVLVLPGGGVLPGRGSVMNLAGHTWEEMTLADAQVQRLMLPAVAADEAPEKALENDEFTRLTKLFDECRRDAQARAAGACPPHAPGHAALAPFLVAGADGRKKTFVIDASSTNQLRAAVLFAEKEQLDYVLLGCRDAWQVAEFLKQHGARCLVANSIGLPGDRQRDDAAYQNAARLHAAGVKFALVTMEQENVRWLGHHAGMAAAFGLPRDVALRAITLAPAELLGVADRVGSLEAGKVANVIVTDGDPLELRTHVRFEWIAGKPVRLVDKQTELYETWKKHILAANAGR